MITLAQYKEIDTFLKEKAFELWNHENKVHIEKKEDEQNMFQEGFSIINCFSRKINDTNCFFLFSDSFQNGVFGKIEKAKEKYPEKFGTNNAYDVIDALYNVWNTFLCKEKFVSYLQNFACCYILYENSYTRFDILRIDLFRRLDRNKENSNKCDFTGGLLHALKHFSMKGCNLSTGHEKNDISNVLDVLNMIANSFLERKERCRKNRKRDYVSYQACNEKWLCFSFYKEEITGVYFLNTCFKCKKPKSPED